MTHFHLDAIILGVATAVAAYYKIPVATRERFERTYPRLAAFIGVLAALVPFLPALANAAKSLVTGQPVAPSVPSIYPPAPQENTYARDENP